jgi:lipoprotein-anchoring transpeptidase ErfK/SrfK
MKALIATAAIILAAGANAQTAIQTAAQTEAPQTKPANIRTIVVSLEDHKLALVEDGIVQKTYTVAVGKPSTPSPEGSFTIARRVANPTYQHNGKTIPAGPGNPVGTRWMGLSKAGYGIHGTNEPNSIGKSASHGCIRMAKADLEEFYKLVGVGDTVQIIGHRNEETAALFSPAPKPSAAPAATVQASVETPANAEPAAALAPAALITPAVSTTATLSTAGQR